MQTYLLIGETPSKKNSRIINTKTGRSFPSKRYAQWHRDAVFQITTQQSEKTIDKPCKIKMTFIHGDLRRRDSDNGSSSILDLLTDTKVIADDNWQIVKKIEIENGYKKNEPCCIVEIEPL